MFSDKKLEIKAGREVKNRKVILAWDKERSKEKC